MSVKLPTLPSTFSHLLTYKSVDDLFLPNYSPKSTNFKPFYREIRNQFSLVFIFL